MQYPLISEVEFHGDTLTTISNNGIEYIAMKPVIEAIGLDWKSQHRKLMSQKEKYGCGHMTIPSRGGLQEMLCMPLRKLNGWLFSINPAKVKDSIRDKLIAYQEECFAALHDYWTNGVAVNPRRMTIMEELNQACADYKFDKGIASKHGSGLNEWKVVKPGHVRRIEGLIAEAVGMIDLYLAETGKGKLTRT